VASPTKESEQGQGAAKALEAEPVTSASMSSAAFMTSSYD
jgi:hypothetical protein